MRYVIIFILLGLSSCSTKTTTSETQSDSLLIESTDTVVTPSHEHAGPPEGFFVGLVKPLNETGEMYLTVFSTDNHTELNLDAFDSLVYKDEGYVRKTLPIAMAEKYFYLNGIRTIRLYNDHHGYLGSFGLKRVEQIETEISTEYGAVYDSSPSLAREDGLFYAVADGGESKFIEEFATQDIESDEINKELISFFALDSSRQWVIYHQQVMPSGLVYSTVSSENESYLMQSSGSDKPVLLSRMNEGYHFGRIIVTPIEINTHPVIIVNYFFPESEDYGDYAMVFNGHEYEAAAYGRVK
jgi:hypothetical protein